jgi:hypothetical protein
MEAADAVIKLKEKEMAKGKAWEDTMSDWINELETMEQPEACSIDNPECEACGS